MQRKVTFRDESFKTKPLEEYVYGEIGKYDRILNKEGTPVYVDVVIDPHDTHQYFRVSVQIKTPNFDLFADAEEDDIYRAVKNATDKMYHQLRREQSKVADRRTSGPSKAVKSAYARKYQDK